MGKKRVYELAKELNLNNKDLIKTIQKLGIPVANHMSALDPHDVERIYQHYTPPEEKKIIEQRIQPSIIRRRVKIVAPKPEEAEISPEEAAAAPAKEVEEGEVEVPAKKPARPAPVPPAEPLAAKAGEAKPKQEIAPEEMEKRVAGKAAEEGLVQPAAGAEALPVEEKAEEAPVAEEKAEEAPARVAPEERAAAPLKGEAEKTAAEKMEEEETVAPVGKKAPIEKEKKKLKKKKPKPKDEPARIISLPEKPAFAEEAEPEFKKVIRPKKKLVFITEEEETEERAARKKGKKSDGEAARPFRKRERRIVQDRKVLPLIPSKPEVSAPKAIKRKIRIAEVITVGDLARKMGVKAAEVIKKLWALGVMATINQSVDVETAQLVSDEFGYEVEKITFEAEEVLEREADDESKLAPRPPVVTVMGHVDHGKTKLLDAIRKTDVVASEAGGITQHIGAYHVKLKEGDIVFIDTPGHEAFTAMRARGSHVTDVVILVVAANEGVKEQTIEAINHAKEAGVPIIVAINKIDLPEAEPDRARRELAEQDLVPEEWGGETIFVELSAKEQINIDKLLEMILLQAEMLELKANPDKMARGIVIETRLDKGQGPVATVLIKEGTLRVGDPFVTGKVFGKVRALLDDRGGKLKEAGPSYPVEVLGFSELPEAGDQFIVVSDERKARMAVEHRLEKIRQREGGSVSRVTLENLYDKIREGECKELKAIMKADVHGSAEALKKAIGDINTKQDIKVSIIHDAVGAINESDIMLASASNAIIVGFNVTADAKAQQLAAAEHVDIRTYTIIYEAIDDIKKAMEGLLAPIQKEKMLGRAQVLQVFQVSKIGTIAGSKIVEGKMLRGTNARIIRNNQVVHEGKIVSLKRFKDDVKEALTGYECGIKVENFDDLLVDDIIEAYEFEEVAQKLE